MGVLFEGRKEVNIMANVGQHYRMGTEIRHVR